jgi:hypothetical protein
MGELLRERMRYWRAIGPTVLWWVGSPVSAYGILWAGFKILGVLGLNGLSQWGLSWLSWVVHNPTVVSIVIVLLLSVGVHEGGYRAWRVVTKEVKTARAKAAGGRLVVRSGGPKMLQFENPTDTDIYNANWSFMDGDSRTIDNGGFPMMVPAHTTVCASYIVMAAAPPTTIVTKWEDGDGEEHRLEWPRGIWDSKGTA